MVYIKVHSILIRPKGNTFISTAPLLGNRLKQILVKVRSIATDDNGQKLVTYGDESIMTYKAYGYTSSQFELLYQCDEDGNIVTDQQGNANPNLNAQHKQIAEVKNAVPVAKAAGPVVVKPEPVQVPKAEVSPVVVKAPTEIKQRHRRTKKELEEQTA